jgi:hypothetical protein
MMVGLGIRYAQYPVSDVIKYAKESASAWSSASPDKRAEVLANLI